VFAGDAAADPRTLTRNLKKKTDVSDAAWGALRSRGETPAPTPTRLDRSETLAYRPPSRVEH
jgi:hypothetical protein